MQCRLMQFLLYIFNAKGVNRFSEMFFLLQDAGDHTAVLSFRSDSFLCFCQCLFMLCTVSSFLNLMLPSRTQKIQTGTERSQ